MRVTALIENRPNPRDPRLASEWGLSLHVAFGGHSILFDTGASSAFAANAERLSVDLAGVEAAVLSHHHYDHGGGLERFFELNDHAPVHLGEAPDGECVGRAFGFVTRRAGLSEGLLAGHAERFRTVVAPTEVLPGVHLFPRIQGAHPRPEGNRRLFVKTGRVHRPDDFRHEILMAIREEDGLVVFTGCSHCGVLNMVETVGRAFGDVPIKAVVGGFHLISPSPFRAMAGGRRGVEALGRALLDHPIGRAYTGHCTGARAFAALKAIMGNHLVDVRTGDSFEV